MYHKTLLDEFESKRITKKLKTELNKTLISKGKYWYPIEKIKIEDDVICVNCEDMWKEGYLKKFRKILAQLSIVQVTEVTECNGVWLIDNFSDYILKMDEYGYTFPWLSETYFFDKSGEWLIYVSHLKTVTFAGDLLTSKIKDMIPDVVEQYHINTRETGE